VDLVLVYQNPIGVFSIKNLENRPEYGALIGDTNFRNKGIGSFAKKVIFKYWFETLNQNEIYVLNKKINKKVLKSNELIGFKIYNENNEEYLLRLTQEVYFKWQAKL
jgi:RimJ/RimL family protein N-acetyltransferase